MCGIFGVINFNGKEIDIGKVEKARDSMSHRGPDDYGIYLSSFSHSHIHTSIVLAHRRLSIIDLSPSGHEPMSTGDGRFTILFNGEIYNYLKLRGYLLQGNGKQHEAVKELKSNSDSEVLLKLFAEEREECLNKLRGMFAFVVWDDQEKTFFAARDRFGIKPFYYLYNNEEFIFSSELKAIKRYKKDLSISYQAIDCFLRNGSIPSPLTIYNEVKSLMPGHWLEIKNSKLKIKSWWHFRGLFGNSELAINSKQYEVGNRSFENVINSYNNTSKDNRKSKFVGHKFKYDNVAKGKIKLSLLDTISAHMVSDVEVGAFLSGGIDSTAIISLMNQAGYRKIKTISITFPGSKFDESEYSHLAAEKYKTNHFEYRLQEHELLDDFDKILSSMDQPTIDGINTYFVSKAAANFGLKVVLSGLGGDELFGGYNTFKNIPKLNRFIHYKNYIPFNKRLLSLTAKTVKNRIPAKGAEFLQNPDAPNASYKLFRGLFTDEELKQLDWDTESQKSKIKNQNELKQPMTLNNAMTIDEDNFNNLTIEQLGNFTPLQKVSFLESTHYMANQLLRDSDIFSMVHSLELRVPFVDDRLYSDVLPFLDEGYSQKFPKRMLVEACGDLPEEIVSRPKMGFTFPFEEWMRNGKAKNYINDVFSEGTLQNQFNEITLNQMLKKFESGKLHWSRIWALAIISNYL